MKKLPTSMALFLALILAGSISLLSCGGGGGGGQGGTSTIRGNVADVVAMAPRKEEPSMLTLFKDFFSFSKTANAQGSGVSGITVIALQGGVTVDTSTTDSDGNFILTASPGNVTLVFPDFDASIVIFIPASSVLIIVVVLQQDEVIVEEMEIDGTFDCETGFVEIIKEEDVDLVIDGEGGDCIRAGGNCTLNIDPENIILTDCERCIRAEGGAEVTLSTTDGDISCDANEDGISAVGNATVILDASGSGDIEISGGQNGISAVGTSEVNLFATGVIDIFGGENAVEAKGTPIVDLNASSCMIVGGENAIETDGNATVDIEDCEP